MTIDLLYLHGCPGYQQALPVLEELAGSHGARLKVSPVETLEQAEAERFLGSPSVRVDGRDVEPGAARRTDFGLKCRVYRFGGHQSSVPPEEWIRDAIASSGGEAAGA